MTSIYKNEESKKTLMSLYDRKLASLNIAYEEKYIDTYAGSTHVIISGNTSGKPVVVFHGINAGAPLSLEAIKGLTDSFRIYAIDTIGQTTKSAETRLPLSGNSLGKWIVEVLEALGLPKASFIGVSYGAFLLQRLMSHAPQYIDKTIFVVPGGFVNGPFMESMSKLTIPLIKFNITKKEKDLANFVEAYADRDDQHNLEFQKNTLLGTKMDYRRPPLMKKSEVEKFSGEVYLVTAEHDVFFPSDNTIKRCQELFKNLKEIVILKGSKHIPIPHQFELIEKNIRKWLEGR